MVFSCTPPCTTATRSGTSTVGGTPAGPARTGTRIRRAREQAAAAAPRKSRTRNGKRQRHAQTAPLAHRPHHQPVTHHPDVPKGPAIWRAQKSGARPAGYNSAMTANPRRVPQSHNRRVTAKILVQKAEQQMVLPDAVDAEIAPRQPLPCKAAFLHHPDPRSVG